MDQFWPYPLTATWAMPTAVCTLRLWLKLRSIILQDAAEIFIKHPSCRDACMFGLPVFQSAAFLVSFSFVFGAVAIAIYCTNYFFYCYY
jgi:hypothetical protein